MVRVSEQINLPSAQKESRPIVSIVTSVPVSEGTQ